MFKKIYIEITNICNLNCKFCPESDRKKQSMNIAQFEEIISKIHNHTKLVCLHVKGEPLLNPHLKDFLQILEQYNLQTNITTNGLLLQENLDILKNSSAVRQINISLHSITQNENIDKEKYLNSIFSCAESLPNCIISYRLWNLKDSIQNNNQNIEIIEGLKNFYNLNNLQQALSENEFIKLRDNLFINQDIEFTWPDINKTPIIEKGRCLALKEQVAILVDGTVVPCCLDNNGDIALGNIFNDSLEAILETDKALEIKKNFENGFITCSLCKTCGFLKNLENKRR